MAPQMEDKNQHCKIGEHHLHFTKRTMSTSTYQQHCITDWKYRQIPRNALGSQTHLEGTYNQKTKTSETKGKGITLAYWQEISLNTKQQTVIIQIHYKTYMDIRDRDMGMRQ